MQERRKHKRIQVRKGVVAILDDSGIPKISSLVDISRDGLAFSYYALEIQPADILDMDVLVIDSDIYLGSMKGKIISEDTVVNDVQIPAKTMKRYGVQFEPLTPSQARKLLLLQEQPPEK